VSQDPLREFWTVMLRLRTECPWKAEQTHRSLARYLLEETYETLEAIEIGSDDELRDELGDLLLQVYFHAVVAEERGAFTLDDVARGITDKMHRRNPHVFGDTVPEDPPADAASVDEAWQRIKATERPRESPLDGLPTNLPALLFALKALERGVTTAAHPESLGDRLLALVGEAAAAGVDPEQALREAVRQAAGLGGGPAA
jgi:XTP/dITP diphosphohydrolase